MVQQRDSRGRWVVSLIAAVVIFAVAFVMKDAYCVDSDFVSGADGQCQDSYSTQSIFFMIAAAILAVYSVYRIMRW